MPTIEQSFSAGETVVFPGGEQFHILTANNPVDVTFYGANKKPIETWEQMKAGFRIRYPRPPLAIEIYSATAQTVKIAITSGDGVYARSQGDVNVLDIAGGTIDELSLIRKSTVDYQRTYVDKNAFIGGDKHSPSAGNYAEIVLQNPTGSGVKAVVTNIKAIIESTSYIYLRSNTISANLTTNGLNKYIGQTGAKCIVDDRENTSIIGTQLIVLKVNGLALTKLLDNDAIILPEGRELIVQAGSAGSGYDLFAFFEWLEI